MTKTKYDYIIVGTGPAGLTLSWYLAKMGKKILLLDRESSIGGCHRVMRVNGLFSEHGPRIYLNNYVNFMALLSDMGLNFYDLFVKYNFQIMDIGNKSLANFSVREMIILSGYYLQYMFDSKFSKTITMYEFCKQNNFSAGAMDYLDRLCRLTDGAELERYLLFTFFELINQNSLYNSYQPVLPNDIGLFEKMLNCIEKTGNVDVALDTEVIEIKSDGAFLTSTNNIYYSHKYVLAIPPMAIAKILSNSVSNDVKNMFGRLDDFKSFSKDSAYLTYIPITFHFKNKIPLPPKWGFPSTEWGVAYIVLSDYMKFNYDHMAAGTVISTTITFPNRKSSILDKTPNQCSEDELKREVLRQLRISFPELPEPEHAILAPDVYFSGGKWRSTDIPFVNTLTGYLRYNKGNGIYANIYNVGTHNGKSAYGFTSFESAVENALWLLKNELETKFRYRFRKQFTVNGLIYMILLILISYLLYKSYRK